MARKCTLLVCIALFVGFAFAHGNEEHVMGTVTKIAQNSITVETSAKATVEVKIVPETKFTKNGASAYIKDLQIGDRVVIHAKKVKDQLVAHTVQIGAAKSGGNTH